jgi:hypothetical protein
MPETVPEATMAMGWPATSNEWVVGGILKTTFWATVGGAKTANARDTATAAEINL